MLTVRSFAKINLHLRVLQRRSDGFHELETVFQSISLADTLTVERSESLDVTCSDPSIPLDSRNLVYRAAEALMRDHGAPPFRVHIEKRIPAGGGVGGGSSNAAMTLLAIRRIAGLHLPDTALQSIALSLGSDVPFFLHGGTCYATGRGEELTPLPDVGSIPLLLLLPGIGVETKAAYGALADRRAGGGRISSRIGEDAARKAVAEGVAAWNAFTNDLEPPVFDLFPALRENLERLRATVPAWARMTGSGSTLVAAYRSAEARDVAAAELSGVRLVKAETISASTSLQDVSRA